jgi:hypothetical protein
MSDLNTSLQFATTPLPSDLPFYNYGAAAIGVNKVVCIDSTNTLDGTIGNDGVGVIVAAVSGVVAEIGITMEIINGTTFNSAGANAGKVRTQGVATATADGTITAGMTCTSIGATTTGNVIAGTAGGAAKPYVGIALTSAVAGDPILILVQPGQYATT